MWNATINLQLLEDQLDDHAPLLEHAPFRRVVFELQDEDPHCLSLKIFLGCMEAKRFGEDQAVLPADADDSQNVWIHLNSSNKGEGMAEVQFHVYELGGEYSSRLDGDSTARIISKFASAFALPGSCRMTKAKLVALAKYYYLCRQYKMESKTDAERLRSGITISKTFKNDLIAVCRDFGKDTQKPSVAVPRVAAAQDPNSQESVLSEASHGLLDNDEVARGNITMARDGIKRPTESRSQNVDESKRSQEVIKKKLIELDNHEQAAEYDIAAIEREMTTLEAKRVAKKQEQADLKKRKSDVFRSMSPEAAFRMGRQIEREAVQKRTRRD